jgi:hypothetical protein
VDEDYTHIDPRTLTMVVLLCLGSPKPGARVGAGALDT